MDKIFKRFCNSINYNTYEGIKIITGLSGVGVGVTNVLLNSENVLVGGSLNALMSFLWFFYIYLSNVPGKEYTKDVNEIKTLYQEVIRNYNKLNKIFDFNDPVQVYTMFNYLVYKCYLSNGKKFESTEKNIRKIPSLRGANVIMGTGVCRHMSSMLTDIFNDYKMDALNVGCYARKRKFDVEFVSQQEYSKEELLKYVQKCTMDDKEIDRVRLLIDMLESEGIYFKLVVSFEENVKDEKKCCYGNHAISYVEHDGKSYFLDPTQFRIYRLKESDEGVLYDDDDDRIIIKKASFSILNDMKDKKNLNIGSRVTTLNRNISLEEEQNLVASTRDICKDNMDIFEQFYNDNSGLYEEISNKLIKIRAK